MKKGGTIIGGVTIGVCALLVALCLAPRAAAAAPSRTMSRQEALAARLRHIESAFRQDDAAALRDSFTARGKLRLDLPQVPGCPASYGAGQLQVIFGQLFAAARTRAFAFVEGESDGAAGAETAFARATWARAGTAEPGQSLTFTLREEDGDWRIHEILAPR